MVFLFTANDWAKPHLIIEEGKNGNFAECAAGKSNKLSVKRSTLL
jgi:hypothetical protein